jgi:hypothetical protein
MGNTKMSTFREYISVEDLDEGLKMLTPEILEASISKLNNLLPFELEKIMKKSGWKGGHVVHIHDIDIHSIKNGKIIAQITNGIGETKLDTETIEEKISVKIDAFTGNIVSVDF